MSNHIPALFHRLLRSPAGSPRRLPWLTRLAWRWLALLLLGLRLRWWTLRWCGGRNWTRLRLLRRRNARWRRTIDGHITLLLLDAPLFAALPQLVADDTRLLHDRRRLALLLLLPTQLIALSVLTLAQGLDTSRILRDERLWLGGRRRRCRYWL